MGTALPSLSPASTLWSVCVHAGAYYLNPDIHIREKLPFLFNRWISQPRRQQTCPKQYDHRVAEPGCTLPPSNAECQLCPYLPPSYLQAYVPRPQVDSEIKGCWDLLYYFFLLTYSHIPRIKFNLEINYSKRIIATNNYNALQWKLFKRYDFIVEFSIEYFRTMVN